MRIFVFIIALSFLASPCAFATGTAKPPAAAPATPKFSARAQLPKSPAKAKKTVKKKHHKRKYVAPPIDELSSESLPVELPIPIEVVEALSKGDIDGATRTLRTESPSSRSLYLLAEMKRILDYGKDKKPPKFERHEFYQNLGISYHNLFLFLKRNGMTNNEFYKEALKFYKKAGKSRAFSERYEAKLLKAALMAASGEVDKAGKLFGEIDPSIITDNYRGWTYLATFYSAVGNEGKTIESLEKAYAMNPEKIKLWVAICDDFASMRHDPDFVKMTSEWK